MYRIILLILLSVTTRPLASFAQHAFDDLPIDDPSHRSALLPGQDPVKKIRDNLFIKATVDHPVCYPGQQVELTCRLYTALHSTSAITEKPYFDGFIAKERKPDETPLKTRSIDGKSYHGFIVWRVLLTPLQPGDYTLGAITLNNVVTYTKTDGKEAQYAAAIKGNTIRLHVRPLPDAGKPPAFSGVIGKWKARAWLAAPSLKAGDYDTLFVEITGAGSFDNIPTPQLRWPAGFHPADAIQRWQINDNTVPESGKKLIAIPFTATTPGQYSLPAIPFTWFDPTTRQYHTDNSTPLTVQVQR